MVAVGNADDERKLGRDIVVQARRAISKILWFPKTEQTLDQFNPVVMTGTRVAGEVKSRLPLPRYRLFLKVAETDVADKSGRPKVLYAQRAWQRSRAVRGLAELLSGDVEVLLFDSYRRIVRSIEVEMD